MKTDKTRTFVEIGVVGKPHGIGGEVRLFLHNPTSTTIAEVPHLYFKEGNTVRTVELEKIRVGNRSLIVRFEGIATRIEAEKLKGAKLLVDRETLPPPEDDEFYVADLIGLEAFEGETSLGRVISSRSQGEIEVVCVANDSEELEIPLVDEFVEQLDIARGTLLFKNTSDLPRLSIKKPRINP